MIRLPWVSRLAYDAVCAERDRLIEESRDLREHLKRTDRFRLGMTETPRPAPRTVQPPPPEFEEMISGYATQSTRQEMRRAGWRRAREGELWERIVESMKQAIDVEEAMRG